MKHVHHIVPRHMGGNNEPANLVELTVAEHAEEHRKLYEKYGKLEDFLAWKTLSGQIGKEETQYLRSVIGGKMMAGKAKPPGFGEKIRAARLGKTQSEQTKRRISESRIGFIMPDSTKAKISETHKQIGKKPPTGFGSNNSFYGRKHSEETKRKISEAKLGKKHRIKGE